VIDYKVYSLDSDHHIDRAFDSDCPSDADALSEARRMFKPGQRAEVWQRGRFVAEVGSLEASAE
jgi:hypothetical protein